MRKIASLFTVLMLLCTLAFGQARTVTGTVKDDNGNPIPFATVAEAGTKNGTTADEKGNFSLTIRNPNAKLAITAAGFQTVSSPIGEGPQAITLARSEGQLSEVVVTTALGIKRQAKELGYSTARVSNNQLTQAKSTNLQNGLTGKVSGVNITTVNSGVFEESRINLRGIRSLTGNNQPLMVVDGVPTPLTFISTINPSDVQEVNILKGASAAAVYGPDGVNGVIIVTTRRGASGKPFVSIGYTVQLAKVSFLPDLQDKFGSGSSEDALGRPEYDSVENQQYGPRFDGTMRPLGRMLEDSSQQVVKYSPTDERKKFWNDNGLTQQVDVSFGAKDYYISFQDARIHGLMPQDKNRRTSFRLNSSKDYGKFRATANLNYIQTNYNVVNDAAYANRFSSSYNGSVYFTVLNTPAQVPLTSYKDPKTNKYAEYSNYYNEYFVNPYWVIENHRTIGRGDNFLASAEANFDFTDWLTATYRAGASFGFNSYKSESSPIETTEWAQETRGQQYDPQPGFVGDGESYISRITHELFLNGRKEVKNDFRLNYILGFRYRQNDSKNINVQGNNLVVPYLFNLSNRTGESIAFENNFRNRLFSLFGQIGVNYKGWANLEFSAANDWDSRLDESKNSYFYPGVSGSVILTDAVPALKGNRTISYAKVRSAISKSANVNLGIYQLEAIYTQTNGFPYGGLGGFSAANVVTNPLIEPEFVNSFEVGVELGFFRNRINLDATYFHQKNTNQILEVQQSAATGYPSFFTNAADFNNYGVEMDLNLSPLVYLGQGRINFGVNVTYNDNKVKSLFPGINELAIGGSNEFTQIAASSPDVFNYAIVGEPAFVFKLTDYKRDPNGRVIVDRITGDPSLEDSLVTRGRTLPLWIMGFNPSFNWKGLTVAMTWDYRGGHFAYHGIGSDMDFTGISERSAQFNRQRFVFPNSVYWDGSKYVPNENLTTSGGGRNFWAVGATNTAIGTNYFSSAAFWKLRELVISYDIPSKYIGETKVIKKVVVGAVGRNLLTFLPKSNQWTDPEFNYTSAGNTYGINNVFATPPARYFGGSVTLTF
ncbi:SusC/RagA family TonB-linked outer membrane protein [Chitinophagaceae bacterium LB-8]|uniref:SusC/RagA family TonB-linked outer membrane protein n=1 Tax=Paraflavisolibacter caeni TaxID=2982496 RepID=A0A9X2XXR8_9BACT|nr:SusC/RagA family TonB-linked outer membrane protein [Paraflavisolibacter caeni]MCU7551055.1 SusC/RagA family TonB-linked outer membrane protein [Paraflavisolibacter caeni]